MLIKFAKTMRTYREGILNYYNYPISTGPLEGTNNKIKTMKRQAYGFRDQAFFKLKILRSTRRGTNWLDEPMSLARSHPRYALSG